MNRGERAACGEPLRGGRPVTAARQLAAERWARTVLGAVHSVEDPRTMAAWSRAAGVGAPCLRARCRAARVPVAASLAFGRVLRAVLLAARLGWHVADLLSGDGDEDRALRVLLERAGVRAGSVSQPTIGEFLDWQTFTRDRTNVDAVRAEVSAFLASVRAGAAG